jgi:diamine N-acetyltransferase
MESPRNTINMTVSLTPVDKNNWYKCASLELPPNQSKHLATNVLTIAESKFETHYVLRAILNNGKVVGMLTYCQEIDAPRPELYWLFRIMVDHEEQGKGIGRKAIELACKEMDLLGAKIIQTMHKPDNKVASSLYLSLGFHVIGKLDDGDVLLEKRLPYE